MYEDYKQCAAKEGTTISEITRRMIAAFINGDLKLEKCREKTHQTIPRSSKFLLGVKI